MKIECPNCHKGFEIPDKRLPVGQKISFPCPGCKGLIELDLRSKTSRDSLSSRENSEKRQLKGEALKKKILGKVRDLPPMPQTVLKAREVMADPKSNFQELADLFETDQAIAAKILKLANSPYYGMGGKVTSIQRASVVLGHKTLGELITMGGASTLLSGKLKGYGLDPGDLWKHSLAVAFGAKFIAQKVDPQLANDAFTSGLIHDAGKLILDSYVAERWKMFEQIMSDGEHTFLDAEKEVLDLDHAEVAYEVCKIWNIPKPLTIAIRYHHHPSRSGDSKLAYIIHVADAVAMMASLGLGIDGHLYQMDNNAMEFLGLREEVANDIMVEVMAAAKNIT